MTVTNLDGNGPVGTATGVRNPDGLLNGQLTGFGCANVTFRMSPQAPPRAPRPDNGSGHRGFGDPGHGFYL